MIKNEIGNVTSPNKIKLDSSGTDAVYKEAIGMAKELTPGFGLDMTGEILYGKKGIRKMANTMFFSVLFMLITYTSFGKEAMLFGALLAFCLKAVYSFLIDRISFKFTVILCAVVFGPFIMQYAAWKGFLAYVDYIFVDRLGARSPAEPSPIQVAGGIILSLLIAGYFTYWFYNRRKNDFQALFNKKKKSGRK